jgi:hypothetical protein
MTYDKLAEDDFERARRKAFWRKLFAWLAGENNLLLPFDEYREKIPIKGQFYRGLKQIPLDQIVGSMGRYREFDRAFSPLQTRTRGRWVSIDKAHYEQIPLAPVELYKMGDIYFVKDGNHRVSVARERGQDYIDAYVTEIVVPFPITAETRLDELILARERLDFLEKTRLDQLRPDHQIEVWREGQYAQLLEHISVHRWYLGEHRKSPVSFEEAALSWYESVYFPVVSALRDQGLLDVFIETTESEMYLWIMKYVYYLRQMFRDDTSLEQIADDRLVTSVKAEAAKQVSASELLPHLKKLGALLTKASWLDELIISQERADFMMRTGLQEMFPDADLTTSIPGQYEKLLEHITVHRWYLGEKKGSEATDREATASWYANVYLPLVIIIRDQNILADFPGRTETDLYLWIISRQWFLKNSLGQDVSVESAVEQLSDEIFPKYDRDSSKSNG